MKKKINYQGKIEKIYIAIFIIFLVNSLLFICCSKPKVYQVGVLSGLNFVAEITDGFKARMTELGYIEGKNIIYDVHNTDFDMAVYDRILKKFVEDKVDLIFVYPTEATMQAKAATEGTNIPVVFANAFTEDTGLVNSIKEPGGNITGVRWPGPEIIENSFNILKELVPHMKRMWVPFQRDYPIVKSQLEVLRKVALSANVTLIEVPASNPEELKDELQNQKGPFDAAVIGMLAEPLAVTPEGFNTIAKFAAKHSIPIGGAAFFEGDYQSVFGIMPPPFDQGSQAAYLADKILKGIPAGNLPVVTADYLFILNYKQAEKLKLNITESLLNQADQVIP